MNTTRLITAALALVLGTSVARAEIVLTADPGLPGAPALFTVDVYQHSAAARNVAADRQLRQTFQLASTIDVAQIVTSIDIQAGGVNGGLIVSFYEVEDVLASSWTPGNLVHSFTIPTTTTMPDSAEWLGFSFTGTDVFTLAQRNTGTQGYGMAVSNADNTSNVAAWRHSNDGTDHYATGVYYAEGGNIPNSARDMGLAIVAVPEPSVALLMVAGAGVIGYFRRRR